MIRSILVNINNNWNCKDAAPMSILFSRYMGMSSRKTDPHIKYQEGHTKNDLHGKILYSPKYGNSYYDALEYDRVLCKKTPNPNEKTAIKLPQDDLIKLLPKNKI